MHQKKKMCAEYEKCDILQFEKLMLKYEQWYKMIIFEDIILNIKMFSMFREQKTKYDQDM